MKLEKNYETELSVTSTTDKMSSITEQSQLSFFQLDDPILEQIRDEIINIEINSLTPVEALMKLNEIKKMITGR